MVHGLQSNCNPRGIQLGIKKARCREVGPGLKKQCFSWQLHYRDDPGLTCANAVSGVMSMIDQYRHLLPLYG